MFKYQQIHQRVYKTNKDDERFCLICNKKMDDENTLESLFLQNQMICTECEKQMIVHRQKYKIDGIDWYVYYEYNEFLERLLFRYKEQMDVVLKDIFKMDTLEKISKGCCICIPPSSDEKRMERAFEPLYLILEGMDVYSPLYKISSRKQSSQSFLKRKEIKDLIYRKNCYPMPNKPIVLVDDVCTSGSTIERCIELLKPSRVFIFSAHPLWIKSKELEKHSAF